MEKYQIIYADPPWSFRRKKTGGSNKSGALDHYNTMSLYDITRLPVDKIADDNSVLFMWWVASQPMEALEVVKSWGFTVKTMTGFVWNKTTQKGIPHFGMGNWTRAGSECVLIATKGKPKRVSASVRSVVTREAGRHSQKPIAIANSIVELCGDVPRIELFARDRKEGWDCWGDEV